MNAQSLVYAAGDDTRTRLKLAGDLLGWQMRRRENVAVVSEAIGNYRLPGESQACHEVIQQLVADGLDPEPAKVASLVSILLPHLVTDDIHEWLTISMRGAPELRGEALGRSARMSVSILMDLEQRERESQVDELLKRDGLSGWDLASRILAEAKTRKPSIAPMSVAAWCARELPEPDFLLGNLFSTTARVMLVAPTGLGKTNFALALAFALASGRNFLHWKGIRLAKVLYVDGEMSSRLMKSRILDARRRIDFEPDNLFVLSYDDCPDAFPLNSLEGQRFIDQYVEEIGGVDFIIFDNVQALIPGDMKDEESWQQALPWIRSLTRRAIGQLWIHHTGLDKSRSYGTSAREWQLDTVVLMEGIERPGADIAFTLKFSKARERGPNNRSDFDAVTICLERDSWTVETNEARAPGSSRKPPSPGARKAKEALVNAINTIGEARPASLGQCSVLIGDWKEECRRRGVINPDENPGSAKTLFNRYRKELLEGDHIIISDLLVWLGTVS